MHSAESGKARNRMQEEPALQGAVQNEEVMGVSWARGWALTGAAAWAGLAVLAKLGLFRVGTIELLFLFAPLVIVPLGMELGKTSEKSGAAKKLEENAQILQPLGAATAIMAMWLPPGKSAGLAAGGWMVICGLMAAGGVMEVVQMIAGRSLFDCRSGQVRATQFASATQLAASVGRIDLAVGGAWLVASRLGWRVMGIQEPIGLLTGVHFHFAGFATATIAAATLRSAEIRSQQRWLRRVVVLVVMLPFAVATGFVVSPELKMIAAAAFSLSVAALAGFIWKSVGYVEDTTARMFLSIAAGSVLAAMTLSFAYVVSDFLKSDLVTISLMASTHGVLNAVGFCLCGLLGWLVEEQGRAVRDESPQKVK